MKPDYKVLVPSKGSKKGYFWNIIGVNTGLIYALYEDGSRREEVILNELENYQGTVQSDAFSAYKKLESGNYPLIQKIACIQHIKRKFIDCGETDKEARRMVDLFNQLYQKEHQHKIGQKGWTQEDNLKWRRKYAPPILSKIKIELQKILANPKLLPKEDLCQAAKHAKNEWNAVAQIFMRGDTHLDNNLIERYNRYFSLSRKNSLFFGSHKGAERGAMLYSLALSCKMSRVNFFDWVKDVIAHTAER